MKRDNLEGKTYNKLYVKNYIGNGKYSCECECGNVVEVYATNLKTNHTTSCGCNKTTLDLTSKVFGYLKAIKRSDGKKRGKTKRVTWQCECLNCGKIVDMYADYLVSGNARSCGCLNLKKNMPDSIQDEFVDGTQLSKITSTPTKSNKSGVVGVNWDKARNKWMSSIRFKGHKYNLGRFDNLEDAIKVRKLAEEKLFGEFFGHFLLFHTNIE